jgi:hypothetical protein
MTSSNAKYTLADARPLTPLCTEITLSYRQN